MGTRSIPYSLLKLYRHYPGLYAVHHLPQTRLSAYLFRINILRRHKTMPWPLPPELDDVVLYTSEEEGSDRDPGDEDDIDDLVE